MTRTLVLGGARSGKSAFAERRAIDSAKEVVYIATARAGDSEMVDCLTLWLSNVMFSAGTGYPEVGAIELPQLFHRERAALLEALALCPGEVALVSNEVGMGIVPWGAVSRAFADEAGRLNQAVAAVCERVIFVAAGLPLFLKGGAC
jgi:adenosylcobinamide kinase/adenosylcobinamide-phosphate guanylyltransferase